MAKKGLGRGLGALIPLEEEKEVVITEENKENTFNGSFKAHLKSCCMDSCFGGSVESF